MRDRDPTISVVDAEDGSVWRVVGSGVNREEALSLLPEDYATALRLRDDGLPAAAIAARLELDEDVIATFLEIGEDKLRRVMEAD